ncbi:MAG: hypothetical protein KA109_09635 [Saprospiraceae bacterium]|jgi:hypothetical protein|nr:hypothetical protein [Saprospiraceae bacterium]MBK6478144.1 hypothetical protein [Saprospiraceae bacterium]MBK6817706.1 hypothetical protein [Saprospiraceae bacterium]MBK7439841.1 hypothetical protein [Saprospiraceae bacterium]MBK7608960.1 hypothetical protein [Saprospiraceae bacterium]
MLYGFIASWLLFLALNYKFSSQTFKDNKFSSALKAFVIVPLALLSYIVHPWLTIVLPDGTLFSLAMMALIFVFAFGNLWLVKKIRMSNSKF